MGDDHANQDSCGGESGPLLRVEPGYRNVLRVRLLLLWVPLSVAAIVLDRTISPDGIRGLASMLVPLLGLMSIVMAPQRIYSRLGYRVTGKLLQVVRGWLFHVDTVVPLVRVQHLDVVRGPLDKMFGTASLVVHTAGTHNSVVTVPGLAPQTAADIRETIREHVRTDFG